MATKPKGGIKALVAWSLRKELFLRLHLLCPFSVWIFVFFIGVCISRKYIPGCEESVDGVPELCAAHLPLYLHAPHPQTQDTQNPSKGRISSRSWGCWEEYQDGKGPEILGKKINLKNSGWEEYRCRELYTSLPLCAGDPGEDWEAS